MKALGLTDGSTGMIAQVQALANALGAELELHTIAVRKIWHYLPNRAFDCGFSRLCPITEHTFSSLPELVISCGRKAALVAASLATHHASPNTKRIHIQHPQMSSKHFDAVIAMEHDNLKGGNVINTPYALTNLTAEKLSAAKAEWSKKFGHFRKPWNAVLIGGSTNKYRMNDAALDQLISDVEHIQGSLFITTSRRTSETHCKTLQMRWGRSNRIFLYTNKGENPYLGMLACADHVYVTNDSVNMMSEAKASGKPVSILKLRGHKRTKPTRFAEQLSSIAISPQEMMQAIVQSLATLHLGGLARGDHTGRPLHQRTDSSNPASHCYS